MVEEPKIEPLPPEIPAGEFPVYITKSNFYRVVHADGVFGGGAPTPGNIMLTFFSHRVPFPSKIVHDVKGNEILQKREVKWGVEQEFEVSLVMSLAVAQGLRSWLDATIKNAEALLQQSQDQQK